MRFDLPLLRGVLVRRYKRFLSDVELASGEVVVAHCPNSGTMLTCADPGRPVLLSDHGDSTPRKLRYTWEAIRMGRSWVGVNTMNPNRVVAEAVRAGRIPELTGYRELRREVACGEASRIDLRLAGHAYLPVTYVEVKNATMRVADGARFPDAVTERGARHLRELMKVARRGERAVMFFFLGRGDCRWVGPADDIDPLYGRTLRRAARQGVEILAYRAVVSPRGITLRERVDVVL